MFPIEIFSYLAMKSGLYRVGNDSAAETYSFWNLMFYRLRSTGTTRPYLSVKPQLLIGRHSCRAIIAYLAQVIHQNAVWTILDEYVQLARFFTGRDFGKTILIL